jgi:hypothetical protein
MTLPRKGSRQITVHGRRFRWIATYASVSWCEAVCPQRLAILHEGRGGQLLIVRFWQSAAIDKVGNEWNVPRIDAAVTPRIVAAIIRAALAIGWEPEAAGMRPFEIDGDPFLPLPAEATKRGLNDASTQ